MSPDPLVPWWAPWASLALRLALWAAVCWIALRVGARLARVEVPEGAHWTERARRMMAVRSVHPLLIGVGLGLGATSGWAALASPVPAWVQSALGMGVALVIGVRAAGWFPRRRRLIQVTARERLHEQLVLFSVLYCGLLPGLGSALLAYGGAPSWLALGVGAALALFFGLEGGLRLLRWAGVARPAPPEVWALLEPLSLPPGRGPAGIWRVPFPGANAFALYLTRHMLITDELYAGLGSEELRGVMAHEVGHMNDDRRLLWLRTGVVVALYLGLCVVASGVTQGVWSFIVGALSLVVSGLVIGRISLRMETHADAAGGEHGNATYARALSRIYEINEVPAVLRRSPTHPDLYDRLVAVGVQPDYPRPEPPSRWAGAKAFVPSALILAVGLPAAEWGREVALEAAGHDSPRGRMLVLLGGPEAAELGEVGTAILAEDGASFQLAEPWISAALQAAPEHWMAPLWRQQLLLGWAGQGRCDEADRMLGELRAGGLPQDQLETFGELVAACQGR